MDWSLQWRDGLLLWRHELELPLQDLSLLVGALAEVEGGLAVAAVEQVARVSKTKIKMTI